MSPENLDLDALEREHVAWKAPLNELEKALLQRLREAETETARLQIELFKAFDELADAEARVAQLELNSKPWEVRR